MKLTFHRAERVQDGEELVRRAVAAGYPEDMARKQVNAIKDSPLYLDETNTYQVQITPAVNGFEAEMVHLSIKRVDREPIHDWRVMQAIKNALVGEECEAIELYPAESRLIDTSNQYHLFAFTDPEVRVPFGFTERCVTDAPFEGTKQRPLK